MSTSVCTLPSSNRSQPAGVQSKPKQTRAMKVIGPIDLVVQFTSALLLQLLSVRDNFSVWWTHLRACTVPLALLVRFTVWFKMPPRCNKRHVRGTTVGWWDCDYYFIFSIIQETFVKITQFMSIYFTHMHRYLDSINVSLKVGLGDLIWKFIFRVN